ncbi:hypothetical protein H4R33_005779 [Dimargaris cristalligena]|uniref:Uncharacterized protein n=1 Tax=Dimargaris cristalligena TaxID=215637 RepID=A0A4P9ZK48_9FUNG|nr:hypothetical protein H4R33_005779 [Dimargaris cristalligena]RKP33607.1 hypothetical protein BJ085DRAFT_28065 [Dimargaris cristalligena]|eukprot:RKP33607.1 hypothetical protein BJ085DRAFT_28065 [Dimargaris cristalligena]
MKPISHSVTLVGMMVVHCAVAYPQPVNEGFTQEPTGLRSFWRAKYEKYVRPVFRGPMELRSTIPGGFDSQSADESLAQQINGPVSSNQALPKRPSELPSVDSRPPNLGAADRPFNPSYLALGVKENEITSQMSPGDEYYPGAVQVSKVIQSASPINADYPEMEEPKDYIAQMAEMLVKRKDQIQEKDFVQKFVRVELTNTMLIDIYTQLRLRGKLPTGEDDPKPDTYMSNFNADDESNTDDYSSDISALVPKLQDIYAGWGYLRLDQLSPKQLADVFPLAKVVSDAIADTSATVESTAKILLTIATRSQQFKVETVDIGNPVSSEAWYLSNTELSPPMEKGKLNLRTTTLKFSVFTEIIGFLIANRKLDVLEKVIAEIVQTSNNRIMFGFAYMMVLEFDFKSLQSHARNHFYGIQHEAILCSKYLGFKNAHSILGETVSGDQIWVKHADCVANYGARGTIHLSYRADSNNSEYPLVSLLAHRSALPNYVTLPESAFEDNSVVRKLII